jgi:DNA-binding CsgD family transcriptional regulator
LIGDGAPTSIYIGQYAQIIIQKAASRALIGAAGNIAAIGYEDHRDVAEALDRAFLELRGAAALVDTGRTHFEKAGFRAYSLAASRESWKLVLSRVDVNDREPKGLVTLYSPGHPQAQAELDGYVFSRTVGLFGGTNLKSLAKELSERVGEKPEVWQKRLDYLAQRTIREAQASAETILHNSTPDRPQAADWIFRGRIRAGRTISLFGPGSAGKTTISDGLALSACTGVEIVPHWLPAGEHRVMLLDWDEGKEENDARMYAMCHAYGVELKNYTYRRMSRSLADCADDVGKAIVDSGTDFLIVSPVSRALSKASGDQAPLIHELYEVLREFGTANLLIAHVVGSAIGADRPANREYGSVSQRDDARGSYSCYAQSEEPGTRVVVLRHAKPDALMPKMDPQAIRIEFDPPDPEEPGVYDTIRFEEDQIEDKASAAADGLTQAERLVAALRQQGPMSEGEIAEWLRIRPNYVRRLVQKAREKGQTIVNEDKKYSLLK